MSDEQLIPTPGIFGENGNIIIERELGRGGMGGVYMGRDKMLDRPVAVKAMLREYGSDPEFVERFKKEAQAAARLIHPNIAQIYSYGICDGIPYIVMELVAGGSLDQVMRTSGVKTDVPRVMKICEQVAQALRCAADQGLVHGDVKPENILLDANGNAKLVDFGLAAMQKDTDEIWGTPYYIAPEKVRKDPVDYRADMFSLGGTIYHALCGVAPFEGDDATAVVRRRFEGPPAKPSSFRPGISPQIDFLVMKMLAVDPADRYPTFEALLADFKKVMATGLNSTGSLSVAEAASAGAAVAAGARQPTTAAGGKKIVLKPKKRFTTKPRLTETDSAAEGGGGIPSSDGEEPAKTPAFARNLSNGSDDSAEEDEGGVGGKVLMVVGSIIGVVVLVAGGLIWYQVADRKSRAAELQAQIQKGFFSARDSLAKTKSAALKFADEFDAFAAEAVEDCQRPTDRLGKILSAAYSDDVIAMLKPAPTKELLDAIASTNAPVAAAETATNAVPAAAAQVPDVTQRAASPLPRFRPPTDAEADPNSPEGEQYVAEKRKWEDEQRAKAAAPAPEPETAAEPEKPAVDADGKRTDVPAVVRDINELWVKAYGCQAAAIRIRKAITGLVAEIEAAERIQGEDEATMRKLADLSNDLKGRYDEIKNSNDVTVVQKAKGFINSRGDKSIRETERKLREEAAQKARADAKKAREEAEKKRLAELAEAKARKIEEETASVRACYEKIVSDGKIRQLDWKGAYRIMGNLEPGTAEGQIELQKQKNKIECMELMQNILVRGLKDYTFTRGSKDPKLNLRGAVVKSVNASKIVVQRKGVKRTEEIPWQTFYGKYHNNLDEIISRFIIKNGAAGSDGARLSKLQRFEATIGAAFIMRIVCSDNPSAAAYAEKLVKDAVKGFPVKFRMVKEYFPDMDFSDIEAEIAAENV